MFLRKHDAQPYIDLIEQAVLSNVQYDAQCEGFRRVYLLDVVDAVYGADYWEPKAIAALATAESSRDAGQLIEVLTGLAKRGRPESRKSLFDAFERGEPLDLHGSCEILEIDGISGLVWMLESLDRRNVKLSERETWYWHSELLELGATEEELKNSAENSKLLAQFLRSFKSEQAEAAKRKPPSRAAAPSRSFADLIAQLENPQQGRMTFGLGMRWGKVADETQLALAAEALLTETRIGHVAAFAAALKRVQFPIDVGPLLSRVVQAEEVIARQLLKAVEGTKDKRLRDFVLRGEYAQAVAPDVIDLLARNYEPGDQQTILRLANSIDPEDDDALHSASLSILSVFDQNVVEECLEPLLLMYEHGPCSFCRNSAVTDLIKQDLAPRHILEECLWDSDEDTRKIALEALRGTS